jgi:cytochrome c553
MGRKKRGKMKTFMVLLLVMLSTGMGVSLASAAGDPAKGKILFNDTHLGGATAGRSCNSCHPGKKGLEKTGARNDLPEIINACIENALKGKPLDRKSGEMADLVAYIESLKGR